MKEIQDGTIHTNSHWSWKSGLPRIAVDFHHTITTCCEACPNFEDYKLQEGVKEALDALSQNFRIVIYTGDPTGNEFIPDPTEYKTKMIDFLRSNGFPFEVLFTKPPSIFMIDDRAIHHKSWAETLEEIKIRRKMEVEGQ